jgi:hypothetical protein
MPRKGSFLPKFPKLLDWIGAGKNFFMGSDATHNNEARLQLHFIGSNTTHSVSFQSCNIVHKKMGG